MSSVKGHISVRINSFNGKPRSITFVFEMETTPRVGPLSGHELDSRLFSAFRIYPRVYCNCQVLCCTGIR
jgi:hypothetical protein